MLTKQQIEIGGQGRQKEVSEHGIPGIKRTLLSLRFQRWNPFNDRSTPGGDRLTVWNRATCLPGSRRVEGVIATGCAWDHWNPLVSAVPALESASGTDIPSERYTNSLE